MTPERWQRVEALLHEALELPPEQRAAFLDARCGSDAALRAEVDELIAADAAAEGFLETSPPPLAARLLASVEAAGWPADALVQPGQRIGPYEILHELGRGGMGLVYKARDTRLARFAALKFLPPHRRDDARAQARFIDEARAASALDHVNVCTIFDIGQVEPGSGHRADGQTYIAMAHYEGETLRERLARGALPVAECVEIACQIARGLAEAHRHGIIHRDLKPANIMITRPTSTEAGGVVKILDFGLAKLAGGQSPTRPGMRLGTAAYMAPEAIRGEAVDQRADLWALGVVLYEMLTGHSPFQGDRMMAVLEAVVNDEPAPLEGRQPAVPAALAQIVMTLLRKHPDERYAHSEAVLNDLEAVRASESRPRRALRRWGVAGLAALLLALGTVALWQRLAARDAVPVTRSAVAVLPFSVRGGPHLAYLREGMMDLLSTKLDGVAVLRSLDPHALLGYLARQPDRFLDPQRGGEVAAHFGAGHYILGSVAQVGERLHLQASLYDRSDAEPLRAQTVVESEAELLAGVDDLARQLVAGQLDDPGEQLASLAAVTTASFPALQAYLEGERLLRDGRHAAALAVLQQAVAADSAFALAWYRLARAAGWGGLQDLNEQAIAQAMRYSGALPDRTRRLITAYYAFRKGDPAEAERSYRAILASYPDDMEAWYLLGEALFHNNPFFGRPTSEARLPFERALSYAPDNREILVHLMDAAARAQRLGDLDSLTARYLRPAAEGEPVQVWHTYRALRGVTLTQTAAHQDVWQTLERAGPEAIYSTLIRVAPQLGGLDVAERLAGMLAAPVYDEAWQAAGRLHQALFALARGRRQEAAAYATGPAAAWVHSHRVLAQAVSSVPASPADLKALRAAIAAWDTGQAGLFDSAFRTRLHTGEGAAVKRYLLGLLDARLNDDARSRGDAEQPGIPDSARAVARSFTLVLDAVRLWRQHGEEALALLDDAQLRMPFHRRLPSPLYEQVLNRYLRAEVLYSLGRYEEALPWYASLHDGYYHWGVVYLGPSLVRRAQIYEHLGERDQAVAYYQQFVALWASCDPPLRPLVEQAQRRLAALADGEP